MLDQESACVGAVSCVPDAKSRHYQMTISGLSCQPGMTIGVKPGLQRSR